jgi:hypothetical protein
VEIEQVGKQSEVGKKTLERERGVSAGGWERVGGEVIKR